MKLSEHILKQLERFKKPYGMFEEDETNMVDRCEDIKRIFLYTKDKYLKCEDDTAIFWNIASPLAPHFKKNILPSVKDFYPEGRGEFNQHQSWILKVRFRKWARESGFAFDLDDLAENLSVFGECIWKITNKDEKKDINVVDLRRIYFDRTMPFEYSDKVEVHLLTRQQILDKKGVWDGVDEIVERGDKQRGDSGMEKYKIMEFEGYYEDKKIHTFVSGAGDNEIVAFKEELDKEKTRYFRFKVNDELAGVYQRLLVLQELANRRVNQNDEAQAIASLLLLRTQSGKAVGNALLQARSGDIVNDPTLEQVPIDNRAISTFINEMAMIQNHAQELCMTPEVMRGEDLPSGTPFRSVATLTNKAAKAFKSLRTRISEQIIEILISEIFPSVVKNWENEYLEIIDNEDDLRKFDERIVPAMVNKWAKEYNKKHGYYPSYTEMEEKKIETIKDFDINGRRIFIEKGYFNWDYGFIYNPSNEIEDRAQQNDVINNLLQYKMAKPMIANDPLFRQLAEKNGVNAFKIDIEEAQQIMAGAQAQPEIPAKQDKLLAQVDSNG